MRKTIILICLPVLLFLLLPHFAGELHSDPVYVAQVGETQYETLQAAIDAAAAQKSSLAVTVTLLQDVTENISVPEGKWIVLDLNTHTLTGVESANAPVKVITVSREATFTIKNGTLSYTGTSETEVYGIYSKGAPLHITNMTLTMNTKGPATLVYFDPIKKSVELFISSSSLSISGPAGNGIYFPASQFSIGATLRVSSSTITVPDTAIYSSARKTILSGSNSITAGTCFQIDPSAVQDHILDFRAETSTASPYHGALKISGRLDTASVIGSLELFSEAGKKASEIGNNVRFSSDPTGFPLSELCALYPSLGGSAKLSSTETVACPYLVHEVFQGTVGTDNKITWRLESEDLLCFYGEDGSTGLVIPDYTEEAPAPWAAYSSNVDKVFIGKEIGQVGANCLASEGEELHIYFFVNSTAYLNEAFPGWEIMDEQHLDELSDNDYGYNNVEHYIDVLLGTVVCDIYTGKRLTALRSAYDSLRDEMKADVSNYSLLTSAEAEYAALLAAHPVTVLTYSRLSGIADASVTPVSGGGDYLLSYGAVTVTAPEYKGMDWNPYFSFTGWYSMDESGNLSSDPVSTACEYTFQPERYGTVRLAAVYEPGPDYTSCNIIVIGQNIQVDSRAAASMVTGEAYRVALGTSFTLEYTDSAAFLGWYNAYTGALLSRQKKYTFTALYDINIQLKTAE